MEDVLQVYHRPYSAAYPLVCFDEASQQQLKEQCQPFLEMLLAGTNAQNS